ncbi:NAD(P)(+) transhydrogenase (Re/Si-specific) subunit beta [soil metagenome]
MLLAVVLTLLDRSIMGYGWIAAGMAVGAVVGATLALKIQMTAMPQMVALLNGFGGLASAVVAGAAMVAASASATASEVLPVSVSVAAAASGLIGAITLSGSLVAFAKLQELLKGAPVLLPYRHLLNAGLALSALGAAAWVVLGTSMPLAYALLAVLALGLGALLVLPVGGADMPVVIALLNAFSGLAAAATGFVIDNTVLIIAGSLVGSSGVILTRLMCRAMNRSLTNVIFGVMASGDSGSADRSAYDGKVKSTSGEEVAMLLDAARRVVIVPGYGLAVAQAQHAVRELTDQLVRRGKEVEFGIHPVAGRMPGHMNVLLAEAEIPYERLKDMDQINPTFSHTDVVLVIGANDVVNPLARTDPTGPIGGMPILNVDEARTVVVIKRSLSPGYAGIDNPLFASDKTLMLFADAKKGLNDVVASLSEL